jgi:uncharacterized repeat protein (TIGR03803 family)
MTSFLRLSIVLLAASTPVYAQTYTVIHDFGSKAGDPSQPRTPGTIAQGRDGGMLTTTPGKAFEVYADGSLQLLHQFGTGGPWSGLTQVRSGMFYGTTRASGTSIAGTVFKMSPTGSITTVYEFAGGADGIYPDAGPIQSLRGDFYGTTAGDGHTFRGTVYKIATDGVFTVLHTFDWTDGASPRVPLVQGTDYYLYGTTVGGGQSSKGTIFRVSPSGDFKVLVNFNGMNGNSPYTGLIQANDGNFYGVTLTGGLSNAGVLFRITRGGTLTVLHNFTGGSDGSQPTALMQASDGNLYGTNEYGGKNDRGVIFRATLTGDVVPLHDFDDATGAFPTALIQHTTGKLYGDTFQGGAFGSGVFYSFDVGLRPFVTYLPTYGRAGAVVQILGQGFNDTSEVLFNGTPATSPFVAPTFIQVTVPDGATTGPITVTTSTGTLTSDRVFIVHPN